MKSSKLLLLVGVLVLVTSSFTYTQKKTSCGYYKDVFMDSGIHLVDRDDLPATRFLDLSIDTFIIRAATTMAAIGSAMRHSSPRK